MRTTLAIDPDVEQLLRRELRHTGRSMKAVVNDALRAGPGLRSKPPRAPRYTVEAHAFGFRPGTDLDRLNQLVDELEAEDTARRLARRSGPTSTSCCMRAIRSPGGTPRRGSGGKRS